LLAVQVPLHEPQLTGIPHASLTLPQVAFFEAQSPVSFRAGVHAPPTQS
jgi:hypothetical protein